MSVHSNYRNQRCGHKHLQGTIKQCKKSIQATKRGLSIISDEALKEKITEDTNAPIFVCDNLKDSLKSVIDET